MSDVNLIADLAASGLDPMLLQRVALELARGQAAIQAEADRRAQAVAETAEREREKRALNAARQQRWRDRNNANNALRASRDVTARNPSPEVRPLPQTPTPTPNPSQTPPDDAVASSAPKGAADRGRRLPDDFAESEEAWRVAEAMGLTRDEHREAVAEFCDHWRSVPGRHGRKIEWPATYRNRLRDVIGRRRERAARAPPRPAPSKHGHLSNLARRMGIPDEPAPAPTERTAAGPVIEHEGDGRPRGEVHEPPGGYSWRLPAVPHLSRVGSARR